MGHEEQGLREALAKLAEHDGGRRLLQLALRGIESGEGALVSGCWTRDGDAGCLFQHSYWQGVREGSFAEDGRARAWVSGVAGTEAYGCVIDVIAAFDRLARAEYAVEVPWFGPPVIDRERWGEAVAGLLVDVLGADDRTVPAGPAVTFAR